MLSSYFLKAQNTSYFMDRFPQQILFNPAFVPDVDFYIALPGMGGVSANIYNSGFTYKEFDYFSDHLMDDTYNPDDFVRGIGNYNKTTADVRVNLLSVGFKTKKNEYISFSVTENSISSVQATSEIAYLLADLDDLNDDDFPIRIDDIDLNSTNYLSYSFTYSRQINENLTVGISPKINYNHFGIQTKDIGYIIELEKTEFDKDYNQYPLGEVLLGMPVEINPESIQNNELNLDEDNITGDWPENANWSDFQRNATLAIDLGATYKLKEWTFSASILNIGASKWRTNGYHLEGNNDETIYIEEEKIRLGIPAKIYLGVNRQFAPNWNYGMVLNNTFYKSGSMATATASLNGYVGKMLSTSVSYTAGYKFDNLGLGLRLRFLPGTDMFFVSDNIIDLFNYRKANLFSAAFGISINVGITNDAVTL